MTSASSNSNEPGSKEQVVAACDQASCDNAASASKLSAGCRAFLALVLLTIVFGIISYPKHPLIHADLANQGGGYDFFHYYAIVNALNNGIDNVYGGTELARFSESLSSGRWIIDKDNHPMQYYLFYLPFAKMNFQQACRLHIWLQLSLFAAGVLALCRQAFASRIAAWATFALLCAAAFFTGPGVDNIWLGQIGSAMVFFLAMTFVCAENKHDSLAGIFLCCAIFFKMYPALLLVYFWHKKRCRIIAWAIGTFVALGISAGLQWGFSHHLNYWHFLVSGVEYNASVGNQSFMGMLINVWHDAPPQLLKMFNLALIIGGSWLLWRYIPGSSSNLAEYSAWILLSMIAAPLSWGHHHVLCVIPLVAFASCLSEHHNGIFWPAAAGVIAVCLTFALEGETVTAQGIKFVHYNICRFKIGLILLIVQLATLLWMIKRTKAELEETS